MKEGDAWLFRLFLCTTAIFSMFCPKIVGCSLTLATKRIVSIDVPKGVIGGLTLPLRLKIWADPPSWKVFEQVTP